MATISQQLRQELQVGTSLKLVTQAYTEISARKLKNIRADIERNRSFFEELGTLYRTIKTIATEQYNIYPIKNEKNIKILITSNYRFYGSLNAQLTRYFLQESTKLEGNTIVIGKTGQELLSASSTTHNFQSLILKKDLPNDAELRTLINIVAPYQRVYAFYSSFKTILTQVPISRDVTETLERKPTPQEHKNALEILFGKQPPGTNYIFEPEIQKILGFFDSQILTLLLEQTFLDSELARTAARLISMDQAQFRADTYIQNQERSLARQIRNTKNTHLLEAFLSLTEKNLIN